MTNARYIIGNGFDLHHGIVSSYKAFGAYLSRHDQATYRVVERYFSVDEGFWSTFEEQLASLDVDTLIDDASAFLASYGAEDWSDSYHHDYQYEIEQVADAVSATLRARFGEWIRQLRFPDPSEIVDNRLPVEPSATFLNFNYTPSLQRLYGVPDSRILHIHGAATDPDASLVLGHGWEPEDNLDPYRFERDPEDADMRVVEGQSIIDDYFQRTFKPTERIIESNAAFFAGLRQIEKIFVMGHSLSSVDHAYFHEVIGNIDVDRVRWKISYFGDLQPIRARVAELGIAPHLVEFAELRDF